MLASRRVEHERLGGVALGRALGVLAGVATMALATGAAVQAQAPPIAHAAATCDDHHNQASAQRAKDTRDADGDGIYCVIYSG